MKESNLNNCTPPPFITYKDILIFIYFYVHMART